MNRSHAVAVSALLLVAAGLAVAFATGVAPLPGGSDAGGQSTETFPTQTPTATPGATADTTQTSADGATATTESADPFSFTIDRVDECGTTCRDVTSTLTNRQSTDATGVTVYSRIFVGNGTDPDDVVWQGSESVGDLSAGESYTTTRRVELSFSEALAVQQADGWITIQTTIETDRQTLTYAERRDVT